MGSVVALRSTNGAGRGILTAATLSFLVLVVADGWFVRVAGLPSGPSYLAAGALVLAYLTFSWNFRFSVSELLFASAVIAYMLAANAFARNPGNALVELGSIIFHGTLLWIIYRSRGLLAAPLLLRALLISVAAVAVYLLATRSFDPTLRLTLAPGFNPSWLAAYIAVTILAGAVLVERNPWTKWNLVVIPCMAVLLVGLLATQGRNALLALATAFMCAAVALILRDVLLQGRIGTLRAWSLCLLGATGLGVVFGNPMLLAEALGKLKIFHTERLVLLLVGSADQATANRSTFWASYLGTAHENVLPTGMANAAVSRGFSSSPHNLYLTMWIELGLPALLVWLVLHGYVIFVIWRRTKHLAILAFALFFPLFALGNDILYYRYYWFGLWVFVICLSLYEKPTTRIAEHRRTEAPPGLRDGPSDHSVARSAPER